MSDAVLCEVLSVIDAWRALERSKAGPERVTMAEAVARLQDLLQGGARAMVA